MDTHLSSLAGTHLETRFLKMDVAHAPFLVERLKVRVLPCVVAFVEGVGVGRVVGFEGLGGGKGDTSCETGDLERWLRGCGVLGGEEGVGGLGGRVESEGEGRGGDEEEEEDDDDDDEWD